MFTFPGLEIIGNRNPNYPNPIYRPVPTFPSPLGWC